jgi:bis(5'-nucleosyl)-tetraphosphatase (symmetrical)
MSTYAIGDLQGCFGTLLKLLAAIEFDQVRDRLWFCGDLVNRGPESLEVLRFVRGLGTRATSVLGNHDLHLLAAAHGRKPGRRDTLAAVLGAPDRDDLLDWLRTQPLIHTDQQLGFTMLHAGLPPQWSVDDAHVYAREVEAVLAAPHYERFLKEMYGDQPDLWTPSLTGTARLRFIVNAFTRLRYCRHDGRLALEAKGEPDTETTLVPWFQMPGRRSAGESIVFGHWSTLGRVEWPEHRVYGLDTGAVWGQRLTALRLEDRRLYSVASEAYSDIV